MMAAALSFTVMTTLVRQVGQEIHPFQIGFVRILVNLVLIFPFVMRTGKSIWKTDNHKAYALRGLFGFAFVLTYFAGAAQIPVSDSQALIFTSPLFVTAMAVLFLGEKLKGPRTLALIILRPGFDEVNIGAVLVLIASFANAASNAVVKYTTRSDHPDKAVFYLMLWVAPMMLIPAIMVWETPTLYQFTLMIGIGIFATFNQRFLGRAFAAADATAVLPFDFARLPFAALIGWLVFSEFPDVWVWVGAAVIFSASIYLTRHEARATAKAAAEAP
jgi:drug/metabolite transporter (DMT)-like permease